MTLEDVARALLNQYGLLGVVLMACALAVYRLFLTLQATQTQRIADAQATTVKLLELTSAQHLAIAALTTALDANADETAELRRLLDRLLEQRGQPAAFAGRRS
jgi:hypothetical protein